jgi:anti-sigma regulatory factor (Ser/Thr protein kinase)
MIPGNAGQPGLRAMRAGQGTRPLRDPAFRASPGQPMDSAETPARDPAGPAGAGSAAAAGSRDDPSTGRAGLRIPPFITRQGRGTDDRWPLQDFLELGAALSAVPCARLHARQVLREWGIAGLADSAGLLVTELVANAVKASGGMAQVSGVRLWLLSDAAQILILVWDAIPQPPVLTDVTDDAEQGRGLRIVEAVSEQWGWYASGNGKFVWAIVRLCISGESHPMAVITARAGLGRGARRRPVSRLPGGLAGADDGAVGDRAGQLAAFCVVANVAAETAAGEGGLEVRAGVRHFAAGAKVWVLPPQWGDGGDQVIVAGHHRGTRGRRGLARMVMPRRHLTGFRVQGVYSPAVIRALTRPLTELGSDHAPRLWATRQQTEDTAAAWRALPLAAHADDWSFTTVVPDPPPLRITREGRAWYLAHFNAQRAVYSPQPPPAEPPAAG